MIRRSANGFLRDQPKPREPMLVRDAPGRVRLGTLLTDGRSGFKVKDRHRRTDGTWYLLENVADGRNGWFSAEDINELAFARGEKRALREGF